MTKYNFRIASPDDMPGIFKVMENVGYIAKFYGGKSEEEVTPLLLGFLFGPENNINAVICETAVDGIIGYCLFGPYAQYIKPGFPEEKDDFAYCLGFGVLRTFQKRGLGTRVLVEAEPFAKKLGYKGMYTDVATDNTSSLRVQEKAGYERIGIFSDKKRPSGVNTVVFKKVF